MPVVTTTDPAEVHATIAEWTARDGASPWGAYPEVSPTTLAARSRSDTPVAITAGWRTDDVRALAGLLDALDPQAASIAGPLETVDAVAGLLGRPVAQRMAERLFRLDELVEPRGVAGRARRAATPDLDYLADWYRDFQAEALGHVSPAQDEALSRAVQSGECWLWLDRRAEPRSLAVRRPAVNGVARIGPVYTPPRFRGHGYGSAVTAAATRDVLAEGAVACLFTDLGNPTSNKIYQALGYVPVLDRTLISYD